MTKRRSPAFAAAGRRGQEKRRQRLGRLPESGVFPDLDRGRKWTIGDVGFGRDGRPLPVDDPRSIGKERVQLLRLAYRREALPDGLELWCIPWSGPRHPITWEEVNWETAGDRVTGLHPGRLDR